ncbi:MAG: alginate O-acetyltransferase [Epulopiscium sp. Nuni2H_MBin003]|nr:MAG: alginate O-acetyltransferase [Epulopiscium sp. Nuni2H_MBin003]
MIFSSITFLFLYLPVTFIVYILLPNLKLKNLFLTIASLLFYAWGEPIYVFLMLISVFFNWKIGLLLEKKPNVKLVILAVILNIGLLFYFKYYSFFIELLNLVPFINLSIPQIRLPIGISFFTFQALSYVIDISRGHCMAQKSYFNLLLYISLFPQLIAGPIVKYYDIDKQILNRKLSNVSEGIQRFIYGLSKKVLIANNMAFIADTIFAIHPSELNIISTWVGAIAYLFQIYFDFSGYSDMAIGLGKMFGFEFRENFNYPLSAISIKDFWRRWHISLSTWFKEYLYIPLGGNRNGARRTYVNQMIVFLATGLWHGANLTFLVWGIFHGIFLILETKNIIPIEKIRSKTIKHLYTLLVVTLLFVIFRADNLLYAVEYIKQMFTGFNMNNLVYQLINPYIILITIIAVCISFKSSIITNIMKSNYILTMVLLFFSVLSLASNSYNPFIYFRF